MSKFKQMMVLVWQMYLSSSQVLNLLDVSLQPGCDGSAACRVSAKLGRAGTRAGNEGPQSSRNEIGLPTQR